MMFIFCFCFNQIMMIPMQTFKRMKALIVKWKRGSS